MQSASLRSLAPILAALGLLAPTLALAQITWTTVAVDTAGDVGRFSSLALDSNDEPHISYRTSTTRHLKYARHEGGSWSVEDVDAIEGSFGSKTSIVVRENHEPAISYGSNNVEWLQYASRSAGVWTIETVLQEPGSAAYNSLRLDSFGVPHICHQGDDFYHTRKAAGVWTTESILPAFGQWNSLFIDGLDNLHLS